MNRARNLCFALIASGFALPAMADCTAPVAPTKVPDGTTAAEAEMVAAMGVGFGDVALNTGGAAELRGPDDDGVFQQAALLQVLYQRCGGLVCIFTLHRQLRV